MIQKKFNINLVNEYFKIVPLANITRNNKKLYEYCYATTDVQKQNVRRRKKLLLVKKTDTESEQIEKLTSDGLEKRLIEALNEQPNNANLLGKAIDFFIKVKRGDKEGIEEEIDMDGFLKVELSEK